MARPKQGPAPHEQIVHRALSDPTRVAILDRIAHADHPPDARSLARHFELHENTVKWHLRGLVDAGLVEAAPGPAVGRGRPSLRYRATGDTLEARPVLLLLADAFRLAASDGDQAPSATARRAGEGLGRSLAATVGPASTVAGAADSVARVFDSIGFPVERKRAGHGYELRMRPCAFGAAINANQNVLCPLHLGLARGLLAALDAPLEAAALDAFVRPDLCILRLERRREPEPGEGEAARAVRR